MPRTQGQTTQESLYWMCCCTVSQWSVSRMNSLKCPNLGTPP